MQAKDVYTAEEQQLLMDSLKNNEPLVLEMLEERKKLLEEFPQMQWVKITTNGLRILYNADSTVKCNRGFRFLSRKEYLKGSFVV